MPRQREKRETRMQASYATLERRMDESFGKRCLNFSPPLPSDAAVHVAANAPALAAKQPCGSQAKPKETDRERKAALEDSKIFKPTF